MAATVDLAVLALVKGAAAEAATPEMAAAALAVGETVAWAVPVARSQEQLGTVAERRKETAGMLATAATAVTSAACT